MNKRLWMAGGIAAAALAAVVWGGAGAARAAASDAPRAAAIVQQGEDEDKGVLIVRVMPGSPAARAGLKRGDVLLKFGDAEVNAVAALSQALKGRKAGDEVILTLARGGEQREVTVKLGESNGQAYLGIMPYSAEPVSGERTMPNMPMPNMPMPNMPMTMTQQGALVVDVAPGGPADKAGIKKSDVIRSVDGEAIDDKNTLAGAIGKLKPGDSVKLEVMREGETLKALTITATLGENPNKKGAAYLGVTYSPAMPMMYGRKDGRPGRGVPMPSMPFNAVPGVVVRAVITDSPAAKAGLKAGDVIAALDGKQVDSPQALAEAVGSRKPGDTIKLTAKREVDGASSDVTLTATLGENPEKKGAAYLGVQLGAAMRTRPSGGGDQGWLPDSGDLQDWLSQFFGNLPALPAPDQAQPPAGQGL